MSAGRDPVDRVIDVVVAVPICAAVAAGRAAPILARAGGRSVVRLLEHTGALRSVRPERGTGVDTQSRVHDIDAADDTDPADSAALPIDGYDHLAARQICDRLPALTPSELTLVEGYERAHRARRTVLGKIEQLRS